MVPLLASVSIVPPFAIPVAPPVMAPSIGEHGDGAAVHDPDRATRDGAAGIVGQRIDRAAIRDPGKVTRDGAAGIVGQRGDGATIRDPGSATRDGTVVDQRIDGPSVGQHANRAGIVDAGVIDTITSRGDGAAVGQPGDGTAVVDAIGTARDGASGIVGQRIDGAAWWRSRSRNSYP